ncbi:hypothetical protein BD414DRAFT_478865 [Trametes punicea]|nr:hypothetical protein BD414DRAFT_478865 [Trametes punicea]
MNGIGLHDVPSAIFINNHQAVVSNLIVGQRMLPHLCWEPSEEVRLLVGKRMAPDDFLHRYAHDCSLFNILYISSSSRNTGDSTATDAQQVLTGSDRSKSIPHYVHSLPYHNDT